MYSVVIQKQMKELQAAQLTMYVLRPSIVSYLPCTGRCSTWSIGIELECSGDHNYERSIIENCRVGWIQASVFRESIDILFFPVGKNLFDGL